MHNSVVLIHTTCVFYSNTSWRKEVVCFCDAAKHHLDQAVNGALSGPFWNTSDALSAYIGERLRLVDLASRSVARQRRDAAKHNLNQAANGAAHLLFILSSDFVPPPSRLPPWLATGATQRKTHSFFPKVFSKQHRSKQRARSRHTLCMDMHGSTLIG